MGLVPQGPSKENCLRSDDSLKFYGWQMKLLPKPNIGHTHGMTAVDGGLPGQLDTLLNFVTGNLARRAATNVKQALGGVTKFYRRT